MTEMGTDLGDNIYPATEFWLGFGGGGERTGGTFWEWKFRWVCLSCKKELELGSVGRQLELQDSGSGLGRVF